MACVLHCFFFSSFSLFLFYITTYSAHMWHDLLIGLMSSTQLSMVLYASGFRRIIRVRLLTVHSTIVNSPSVE